MYLEHFKFNELPFTLTPNVTFFCHLKGHEDAFNMLLFSLRSGEGFIKIIGEVGSGKTLLCRKLLDSLEEDFVTAYIPNPDLNPIELRKALARELGLEPAALQDQHELQALLNNHLLELHAAGKRTVLLIDEAQAIPPKTLETLRLLTNLETETSKLLQVVLFGQPELDQRLNQRNFRQLKQRISFSGYLPLMSREDMDNYIYHRINKAGNVFGPLFSPRARAMLYKASKGVPRVVNILCHKALLAAYGRGERKITPKAMRLAIADSDVAMSNAANPFLLAVIAWLVILITVVLGVYIHFGII